MSKEKDPKIVKSVRTVLMFAAFAFILAGVLVLSRASFLQNPLNNQISELINLPQNEPTSISGVNTSLSGEGFVWGEEIQDENNQAFDNPWLIVSLSGQTVAGQLVDSELIPAFDLPATTENLRIFPGGKFMYTIPSTNIANAKLIAGDATESITVAALGQDEEFIDAYFEATTKSFYFVTEKSGRLDLYSVIPGRSVVDVYDFGFADVARILLVDDANQLMYLATDQNLRDCIVLDLQTKTVQEAFCEVIARDEQVNYVFSRFKADLESFATVSEIKASNGEQRAILESEQGQLYTQGAKFNQLMAFIQNELIEEEDVIFAMPQSILLMDLEIEDVVQQFELPEGEILQLSPANQNLVFTIVREANLQKLVQLVADQEPQEVIINGCELGCDLEFYSLVEPLYEATQISE